MLTNAATDASATVSRANLIMSSSSVLVMFYLYEARLSSVRRPWIVLRSVKEAAHHLLAGNAYVECDRNPVV